MMIDDSDKTVIDYYL